MSGLFIEFPYRLLTSRRRLNYRLSSECNANANVSLADAVKTASFYCIDSFWFCPSFTWPRTPRLASSTFPNQSIPFHPLVGTFWIIGRKTRPSTRFRIFSPILVNHLPAAIRVKTVVGESNVNKSGRFSLNVAI